MTKKRLTNENAVIDTDEIIELEAFKTDNANYHRRLCKTEKGKKK